MPVASADQVKAIPCPVRRAAELSAIARKRCTLPGDLALLRRLALAECRWVLHMTADKISAETGTPRSRVFTLTRGLRPTVAEQITATGPDTSAEQREHLSDGSPDTMTTLTRTMPVGQWNTLARLHRAAKPLNCAVLIAVCDVSMADLQEMTDAPSLISLHQAGTGSDDPPPHWLTSPHQIEARLTLAGQGIARDIVAMSGVLLYLARPRQPVLVGTMHAITGIEPDQLDALYAHDLVEPVTADGDPTSRAKARHLRITPKGRRYTTDNPA